MAHNFMKWYHKYKVYAFETIDINYDGKLLIAAVSAEEAVNLAGDINKNVNYFLNLRDFTIFNCLLYKCPFSISKKKVKAVVVMNGIHHV